jgi:hypothetical protein
VLWSSGSALAHRMVSIPSDPQADAQALKAQRVLRIAVTWDRIEALRMSLDARFERHLETWVYNTQSDLFLVRDDRHYWILHNCNHETADWLRELGCSVQGPACTNDFQLAGESR